MYIHSLGAFHTPLLMSGALLDQPDFGGTHDHFAMMDPMERRGLFVHGPISGGGGGGSSSARQLLSSAELSALFPNGQPLQNAETISHVVGKNQLLDSLTQGALYVWFQEIGFAKVPATYTLSLLPVGAMDVFATLLRIEEIEKWMPRLLTFKVVDGTRNDPGALRRKFEAAGRSVVNQAVYGNFQTSGPKIQGNFNFTYQRIPGGLQFLWNLQDSQEFSDPDKGKKLKTNNCSFTLQPVPGHPDKTYLTYSIEVEPDNFFMSSFLHLFLPGELCKELGWFMQTLVNRTIDPAWTSKGRDPLGVDHRGVPNPSNFHYNVIRLK